MKLFRRRVEVPEACVICGRPFAETALAQMRKRRDLQPLCFICSVHNPLDGCSRCDQVRFLLERKKFHKEY